MMLLELVGKSLLNTVEQIRAERGGSEEAANQAAQSAAQLGLSFAIQAEHEIGIEILDPEDQSSANQLLDL